MKLSLVIPVYNEEKKLAGTLRTCCGELEKSFDDYEIIIVNDGSDDRSADIVKELAFPKVRMISYRKNRGKGYAVRRGVLASSGDIIFYTDADLAYGTEVIKPMADMLLECGADIVIGSRKEASGGYGDYPFVRRTASRVYSGLVKRFSGLDYDTQCGIKCFRKDAGRLVFALITTKNYAFDTEAVMLAEKLKLKIEEYPVKIIEHSGSHINLVKDSAVMLRDMMKIKNRMK
ncbi:MAG: glycosyltransferase [Anaerovoracaceae bacterium]|nr:glycosyltransferase [Bacillota bacterium]MDY2671513.1 glycosyltransferase [Anaerovoracaceae bacterium]